MDIGVTRAAKQYLGFVFVFVFVFDFDFDRARFFAFNLEKSEITDRMLCGVAEYLDRCVSSKR